MERIIIIIGIKLCMKHCNVCVLKHSWTTLMNRKKKESSNFLAKCAMPFYMHESFCQHVECQMFEEISDEYDAFITDVSNKSKTFAFWSMYIKLISKFNCLNSNY